jgi:hypothetical protein
MTKSELILIFVSILTALGVSDLLVSTHKLFRIRKLVKWHWIPLSWAFIAFMSIVSMWFGIQYRLNDYLLNTAAGFLLLLAPILFMLLMSMAVLPDNPKKDGYNLLEWYFNNKNYFFLMLCLSYSTLFLIRIIDLIQKNNSISPFIIFLFGIPIITSIILLFSKKNEVHKLFTILFTIIMILSLIIQRLPE